MVLFVFLELADSNLLPSSTAQLRRSAERDIRKSILVGLVLRKPKINMLIAGKEGYFSIN